MFGAVAAAAVGSVAACEEEEENPELASMAIFSGNANPDLAALIAQHVGKPLGSATVGRFPDGEVSVSVHENGETDPPGPPFAAAVLPGGAFRLFAARNARCGWMAPLCGGAPARHAPLMAARIMGRPAPSSCPPASQFAARTFTSSSLLARRT